MRKLSICLLLLASACAVEQASRSADPSLVSDGSEEGSVGTYGEVVGTIVVPGKEPGSSGDPSVACYAYCADGYFYCPPNPMMECYWVCTRLCPLPDQSGCTECIDI